MASRVQASAGAPRRTTARRTGVRVLLVAAMAGTLAPAGAAVTGPARAAVRPDPAVGRGAQAGRSAIAGRQSEPARARAWVGEVHIPTYRLGPEDPNPHYGDLGDVAVYPYTMQDRFGDEPVDTTYRAAFLENDFLRVVCLPDLGGRIWSVLDKVTGQEVFYRNHVIKPGHLAMRGAWFPAGIEWNRGPRGHGVTSFSPVDVLVRQGGDGSASLLIGDVERVGGTAWQVTLTLRPGVRALEQSVRLTNATDGLRPYYFWTNAALPASSGTRLILPVFRVSDHSGERLRPWPIDAGRDLRRLDAYEAPTSLFAHDLRVDFFGAYDADRDLGVVHLADHHLVPGRKIWTWGGGDDGRVAWQALTDGDGPYIEIQSGPLSTQAQSGELQPGQELAWQERWLPVSGLGGGFEMAAGDVVVQRGDESGRVVFSFAAARALPGATVTIEGIDGRVTRRQLDLSPGRTPSVTVPTSGIDPTRMRFHLQLADGAGESVLAYDSPLTPPRPGEGSGGRLASDTTAGGADAAAPPASAEATLLRARAAELAGDRGAALAGYRAALALDSGYSLALRALARMDLDSGRYERAASRLRAALSRAPDDAWSHYLLALAQMQTGNLQRADDEAAVAGRYAFMTALARELAGRIAARRGDVNAAAAAFTEALAAGGAAWSRVLDRLLATTYAAGRQRSAAELARRATASGTLRLLPHLIPALDSPDALRGFTATARRWLGSPDERFVGLAAFLADLGLVAHAARVLEAACVNAVPESARAPLPMYWLAWLSARAGQDGAALGWLRRAALTPVETVFPWRPETVAVLRYAVERQPDDARAWRALGNLYGGLGRFDEAVDAWRRAATLDDADAVSRRNLAWVAWRRDGDLAEAASWLRRALVLRPEEQTYARDLARIDRQRGRPEQAAELLARYDPARMRADVAVLRAELLTESGRPGEAIRLLQAVRLTHREGRSAPHRAWVAAHLARGRERFEGGDAAAALADFEAALEWPENLAVGRPARPAEAEAEYWRARALEALGRSEQAAAAYRRCAAGPAGDEAQERHRRLCSEALARAGQ